MPNQTTPLSALPYFPLDPAWIEQSEAFRHADPRLAAAYLRVLLASWRATVPGSIPHSHSFIAQVTNLPLEVVGSSFSVLTEGFELLDDGRLHHTQLAKLARRIHDRHGAEIEEFALNAAMTIQAPEQFSVGGADQAVNAKDKRAALRSIPKGFGFQMHPELALWAAENGYPTAEDRDWSMRRFHDFTAAKNSKNRDWAAAYRKWAADEILYGRRPPSQQGGLALGGPRNSVFAERLAAGRTGRGNEARDHNASVFNRIAGAGRGPNKEETLEEETTVPRARP